MDIGRHNQPDDFLMFYIANNQAITLSLSLYIYIIIVIGDASDHNQTTMPAR
jgi:hypothetical protein